MDGRLLRITRRTVVVLAIGGGALLAGCGDDDADKTVTPATFEVVPTEESKTKLGLEFPATIKAGLVKVTLKNTGKQPHSLQIMRLEGDHSVDDALAAVDEETEANDSPPIPDWLQDGGGVATVQPGKTGTVEQVLAPGRYAIWDDTGSAAGKDNDDLGAKGEFAVTGEASDAKLPARAATVTAKEYGFELQGLKAGINEVRFENTGAQLHHALFFPLAKGATIKDATAVFSGKGPSSGPPPVDFENLRGTAVLDGQIAQNLELDLAVGRYAVVCFLPDRKGGRPHVTKGMIEELTIK